MQNKTNNELDYSTIDIGISEKKRRKICNSLFTLLADTYLLYLKTQNYHWNVTGKYFVQLHQTFEEQYQELALAVDEIAERIRMLGDFANATLSSFIKISSIKEDSEIPNANEMIHNLVNGHGIIINKLREIISICDEAEDDVSMDLVIQRMKKHEKTIWYLKSMLSSDRVH
jgi:starvation-inducible DNA-binding protein